MARDFDGTDDRIDWANVFDTTGQALTISLWAKLDTGTDTGYFFNSARSGGNAGTFFGQNSTGAGRLQFARIAATTSKQIQSNNSVVGTTNYHHLLVTDDGSDLAANAHIYVDGSEVTYAVSVNRVGAEQTANSTWSVGGRPVDNVQNIDARLAEVGVWNRILSSDEIALLSDGFSPLFILNGLKFYTDLVGLSTEINWLGAAASTTVGTTIIEHPRILRPAGVEVWSQTAPVTTVRIPRRPRRLVSEPVSDYVW